MLYECKGCHKNVYQENAVLCRNCSCVYDTECSKSLRTCCVHDKSDIVKPEMCIFTECDALSASRICKRHECAFLNKITLFVERCSKEKMVTIRDIFSYIISIPSIMPKHMFDFIAKPIKGHMYTETELSMAITSVGNVSNLVCIHPFFNTLWTVVFDHIKKMSSLWLTIIEEVLYVKLTYVQLGEYVKTNIVGNLITYTTVWDELEKNPGLTLPPVNQRHSMMRCLQSAVAAGKVPDLIAISSTQCRKKTALNCYSLMSLSNCLLFAGHSGVSLDMLLKECEHMTEYIAELESNGLIYIRNRQVYSIGFACRIPHRLAVKFLPVHG